MTVYLHSINLFVIIYIAFAMPIIVNHSKVKVDNWKEICITKIKWFTFCSTCLINHLWVVWCSVIILSYQIAWYMNYISSMQTRITAAEEMHFLLVLNYKIQNAYITKNKKLWRKLAIILVSSFKRKANDLPNFQQGSKSYEQ